MTYWPQITLVGLQLLGVGIALGKHGQPQGRYNSGTSMLAFAIAMFLLWSGGFFSGGGQ